MVISYCVAFVCRHLPMMQCEFWPLLSQSLLAHRIVKRSLGRIEECFSKTHVFVFIAIHSFLSGDYRLQPGTINPPSHYYQRWYSALNRASKSSGIDKTKLIVGTYWWKILIRMGGGGGGSRTRLYIFGKLSHRFTRYFTKTDKKKD